MWTLSSQMTFIWCWG